MCESTDWSDVYNNLGQSRRSNIDSERYTSYSMETSNRFTPLMDDQCWTNEDSTTHFEEVCIALAIR